LLNRSNYVYFDGTNHLHVDMTPAQFIDSIESPRKELISAIHILIVKTNKGLVPEVSDMMGKQMLIYKNKGFFTYALASVKSHMSLHLMPSYANPALHAKYSKLLNKAKFQKGCINFKKEEEMPLDIVEHLVTECSKVDMKALMEKFKKK
jgi:uncharacterized protein YdhG (YjbR/CyaY superfamily)